MENLKRSLAQKQEHPSFSHNNEDFIDTNHSLKLKNSFMNNSMIGDEVKTNRKTLRGKLES